MAALVSGQRTARSAARTAYVIPTDPRASLRGVALFLCPTWRLFMTKRALKRLVREGAFDPAQFDDDAKIRRLPTARGWTPLPRNDDEREQGYLKTIKP